MEKNKRAEQLCLEEPVQGWLWGDGSDPEASMDAGDYIMIMSEGPEVEVAYVMDSPTMKKEQWAASFIAAPAMLSALQAAEAELANLVGVADVKERIMPCIRAAIASAKERKNA